MFNKEYLRMTFDLAEDPLMTHYLCFGGAACYSDYKGINGWRCK